jgi:hypothetical protein
VVGLTESARDGRVEVRGERAAGGSGGRRQCPDDHPCARRQLREPVSAEVLELATHSITHHRAAHLTADDEASAGCVTFACFSV